MKREYFFQQFIKKNNQLTLVRGRCGGNVVFCEVTTWHAYYSALLSSATRLAMLQQSEPPIVNSYYAGGQVSLFS